MDGPILLFAQLVVPLILGVAGWFLKTAHQKIETLESEIGAIGEVAAKKIAEIDRIYSVSIDNLIKELAEHRLHCAETFTTKKDLKEIVEYLRRIEDKLDRKADK